MKYSEQQTKGISTSAYQEVMIISTRRIESLSLLIKNTGATNSLTYKVYAFYDKNSTTSESYNYVEFVPETTIVKESNDEINITATAYDKVIVLIKEVTASTDFEIQVIKKY